MFELGEVSTEIQCPSCAKYWPEGLLYCTCGTCLRPSNEQKQKTKEEFDALSIHYFVVKKGHSRGAKQGQSQEQYDHFKANESTRHAKKKGCDSILRRFQNDELYRNYQLVIGWTEEHCQYLDSLMFMDFSNTATRKERLRYENNFFLGINGQGPKPGPVKKRADYFQAVNEVLVMRKQVEKPNPYIPQNQRFRQRPVGERHFVSYEVCRLQEVSIPL